MTSRVMGGLSGLLVCMGSLLMLVTMRRYLPRREVWASSRAIKAVVEALSPTKRMGRGWPAYCVRVCLRNPDRRSARVSLLILSGPSIVTGCPAAPLVLASAAAGAAPAAACWEVGAGRVETYTSRGCALKRVLVTASSLNLGALILKLTGSALPCSLSTCSAFTMALRATSRLLLPPTTRRAPRSLACMVETRVAPRASASASGTITMVSGRW
mmetsp:Transcript_22531/g.49258  ORF Transcript_22531/g.49258 Transcript_22531/m.49258 type:complete len:214 (-) Transcript_22531:477-1118(-)